MKRFVALSQGFLISLSLSLFVAGNNVLSTHVFGWLCRRCILCQEGEVLRILVGFRVQDIVVYSVQKLKHLAACQKISFTPCKLTSLLH